MGDMFGFFPSGYKFQHIKKVFTPGTIVKLFCDSIKPPKEKYLIFLAEYDEFGLLFFINSKVPPYKERDMKLKIMQIPILKTSYPFFSHDVSYLDCSEVVLLNYFSECLSPMTNDPTRIVGKITSEDAEKIIQCVKGAITIAPIHQKLILESIGNSIINSHK
jgi:hypothetical protein